jgi:hypothetical protein
MEETAMDKWIIESAEKYNLHKFYNTYWKHRNKIEELFDKTGQHGFEPMNQSTKEWIIDEFVKWKEDSLEKELLDMSE